MSPKRRVIIADNDAESSSHLKSLLEKYPELEVVAECMTGFEALRNIMELRPDILFIDTDLPDLDGISLLRIVAESEYSIPTIIVVTKNKKYAVEAFELHATDYLIKPLDLIRLHRTLMRIDIDKDEVEIHPNSFDDTLEAMPVSEGLVEDGGIVGRLMVRKNDRVTLLRMRDVKWIEAAGNYIHLYELSHMYVVRGTLTYLESKLDATQFVRIHRSIIVNLEYVKELLTSPGHGEVKVFMTCGEILTMSKRYRDRFNKMFRRV